MSSTSPVQTPLEALDRVVTVFRLIIEAMEIEPADTRLTVSALGTQPRALIAVTLAEILEQADASIAAARVSP